MYKLCLFSGVRLATVAVQMAKIHRTHQGNIIFPSCQVTSVHGALPCASINFVLLEPDKRTTLEYVGAHLRAVLGPRKEKARSFKHQAWCTRSKEEGHVAHSIHIKFAEKVSICTAGCVCSHLNTS